MPASHNLPRILKEFPHYEGEIARLAEFLLNTEGRLVMVDVGANVGDTVALIPSRNRGRFLCIEGNPNFFKLLQKNFGKLPNVSCVNALVTDSIGPSQGAEFIEAGGTARVADGPPSHSATKMSRSTVDDILSANASFPTPNFLKIDTDGYDLKVLRGSASLLRKSRPALHFELSFRHWREFGDSTWEQAADFLSAIGYEECLLYDNAGYLIGSDQFHAAGLLPVMERYAFRRALVYLNVVTFHEASANWNTFKESELKRTFDV